jgi:hypothetical protein
MDIVTEDKIGSLDMGWTGPQPDIYLEVPRQLDIQDIDNIYLRVMNLYRNSVAAISRKLTYKPTLPILSMPFLIFFLLYGAKISVRKLTAT